MLAGFCFTFGRCRPDKFQVEVFMILLCFCVVFFSQSPFYKLALLIYESSHHIDTMTTKRKRLSQFFADGYMNPFLLFNYFKLFSLVIRSINIFLLVAFIQVCLGLRLLLFALLTMTLLLFLIGIPIDLHCTCSNHLNQFF